MKRRPFGVILLAIFCFAATAMSGVLFALSVFDRDRLASLLQGLAPDSAGPSLLLGLGSRLPIYSLLGVAALGALGFGMWNLQRWARIVMLLLAGILFLAGIVQYAASPVVSGEMSVSVVALRIVLDGLVVLYLLTPPVTSAFKGGSPSQ